MLSGAPGETITWRQVAGPPVGGLSPGAGPRLQARSPTLAAAHGAPLPWGVVPLSPSDPRRGRARGDLARRARRRGAPPGPGVAAAPRARGLPNTAVGTRVYLGGTGWRIEARPAGAAAALEPQAGVASLVPDVAGDWRLADGAGHALTLRAGRYDETPLDCGRSGCHAALAAASATNPMTSVLARGLPLAPDGHGAVFGDGYPGCALACHATGEPGLRDGGFTHVMSELGTGALAPRAWESLPRPLRRLGGVGCLACHGPGALPETSARWSILRTDVCATCHDAPPRYGHVVAWRTTRMARADRDPRAASEGACARCHTTWGFLAQGAARRAGGTAGHPRVASAPSASRARPATPSTSTARARERAPARALARVAAAAAARGHRVPGPVGEEPGLPRLPHARRARRRARGLGGGAVARARRSRARDRRAARRAGAARGARGRLRRVPSHGTRRRARRGSRLRRGARRVRALSRPGTARRRPGRARPRVVGHVARARGSGRARRRGTAARARGAPRSRDAPRARRVGRVARARRSGGRRPQRAVRTVVARGRRTGVEWKPRRLEPGRSRMIASRRWSSLQVVAAPIIVAALGSRARASRPRPDASFDARRAARGACAETQPPVAPGARARGGERRRHGRLPQPAPRRAARRAVLRARQPGRLPRLREPEGQGWPRARRADLRGARVHGGRADGHRALPAALRVRLPVRQRARSCASRAGSRSPWAGPSTSSASSRPWSGSPTTRISCRSISGSSSRSGCRSRRRY